MIQIGLVNLKRSWILVLLFALLSGTSGWSKSLYTWNDNSTLCEWQLEGQEPGLLYLIDGVETDTIVPPLPAFVCDVVCPDFQVNWISIDADCGESNGSAKVTPVGLPADTEFTYNWENGVSNGPEAVNLAPGVYRVVIGIADLLEDQALRDCLIETEVIVGTKEGPDVNVKKITAGNCADLSGSVKLEITDGTASYTISWGDGGSTTLSADGIVNITSLPPGDYTFIVEDAAGCLTSVEVIIPQAQDPISLTGIPPSLCTTDDGSITVTLAEGFPPYTITLNDALEVTTNDNPYTFEGLSVGLYTVKVEYGFVCEAEATIELNTPDFVCRDGWSVIDPVCPGDPAYLYFDGNGSADESFQIRQVNSGFLITSVPGDEEVYVEVQYSNYEVRRTSTADDCLCEFMLSVEPVNFEAQLTVIDGSCEPGNIIPGSISLSTATGGTPPYTLETTDLNGNPVDASNLSAGSYIAAVLDANNCKLSDTLEVDGGVLTGGIEEQEVVICEGDTFQPTFDNAGNPNLTFSWSPTTGLSDPTVASPVITPTEDITYVLNITDPNCGTFSDTLVVDFVPGLNMTVDGNAFQPGQDEIIITVSSNNDSAVYTWYQEGDNTIVDNDGDDTFLLTADQFNSPYYVVGEVNGCLDTLPFSVVPPIEVDYTISVPDIEICEGESSILEATIIPDTILIDSIVWVNPQGDPVGSGYELTLNDLFAGNYVYTATAFSPAGITQTNALVTVLPLPDIDAQPDGVLSLCITDQGNLVELTATATGYPDSTIIWTGPDGSVLGSGGTIMVQAEAGASQYTATLSSVCGEVTDTVTIEVDTEPVLPALPDTLKLCVGQEGFIDLSDYAFSYTWSDCDGQVIPVSGDSIVISGDVLGETCYQFSATNECGTVEEEVTVYIVPEQAVDAQPNDTIRLCVPAPDTCLMATVTGLPNDCIEWTDLSGNLLGAGGELCVSPLEGVSQYIADVPGLDCVSADTVTIIVETLPPPPPALPDTLTLCVGQDTVLDLSSYGFPYTWTNCDGQVIQENNDEIIISGDSAGEDCYIFMASNACETVTVEVIVYVIPEPSIDVQPDSTIYLCGPVTTTIDLIATADGFADSDITWTSSDGTVLGTGSILPVLPPEGTSEYIASTPQLQCGSASDMVTIVVTTQAPPPPVALPDTLKLCVGQDTVIDLSGYGFPYTWADCDGTIIPVSNDSLLISGDQAGEYCYEFSASNACGMTSAEVIVYVVPEQTVDAQPDVDIELCAPVTADTCLTATVTGLPDGCIEWTDFDGNVLGTGNEICVTPPEGTSYYIAGVPGLDCINSDTVTIVVETLPPPPPVALPDTLKLCVGQDTVIDLNSYGFPYTWADCDGTIIPVSNDSLLISGGQAGEYCYEFGASNACGMTSAEVIVYVVPEQTVDAQPDVDIELCAPVTADTCLTATVTGLPDGCIEWTDFDGNVLGTGNEICVTPPEGTSYYIAGVPGLGCINSDTVKIVVETLPPPPPVALPDTLKLCVGQDTVIDLNSYGFPYTWADCDGTIIPVSNDSLLISGDQAGEYCYEFGASNACGMTSAEVIVYVVPEQTVDAQPDVDIELCAPVTVDTCLTATVMGLPEGCIEWTDFDGNVLGTGNELCVTPPEGTSYYIAGVPGLDCINSDTVTIVVEALPPPPVALPDTLKLCVGQDTVIDLSGYGFPYTWADCDGTIIPVSNDSLLISGDQAGEYCYEFSASNACGMTSAEVIVYVVPEQTVDAQPDVDIELCAPVTVDTCLTATVMGLPEGCIEWTDFDGNVLGTGNELCVTPPEGTSYYIAGVPGLDCINSDTVKIVVETLPPPPPVALPDTLKLCVGQEVVIDLSGYGFPYTWSECGGPVIPVANDEIVISGDQAGEYCYEFSASNACGMTSAEVIVYVVPEQTVDAQPDVDIELCAPVTVDTCLTATVMGLPEGCIEWTDFDGNVLGTGNELCVTPPEGTSYYIAGVPGLDCINSDTVKIVVETLPPPPPVALPDTLKLCVGQEVVIDLSGYGFPYTWSECGGPVIPVADDEIIISGGQAGEYCYEFSASNACGMTSAEVIVYVVPEQTVDAQPDVDIELCAPVTVDTCLTATVMGLPEGCIEWTDFDGNVLGTGNELCVTPPEGTSYYIAGAPGLDCINSDTVTIVVETLPPPPPVALPDTLKLCVGQEVVIDLSGYGFPYTWSECGGPVIPVADDEIIISGGQAGEYCYEFGASNACGMTSAEVIVYVVPEQTVDAQPDVNVELCAPVTVDTCLTATVMGLPEGCIEWTDFDGNVLGTGNELCVTPPEGTSYYIAGVPGLDCINSDTVKIVVETLPPPPPVALPDTLKLCVGQEVVIDLSGYGFPYTWSECGGPVIPVADDEIIISGGQAGEYCYEFSASNACGMTSAEVIVYVVPEQTVDAQPDVDIELCAPVTVDTCLTATVMGLPEGCIEWTDFDGNVLGTGNELCVTPPEGTSYYIAGVPGLDCINSDTVKIVVETLPPPPPVALPDTLKLCVGQDTVLDLSSYGFPYTWADCDGSEIPVIDDEIIITGDEAGEFCYTFIAANGCGTVEVEVVVFVVPDQQVDAQPDVEVRLCAPVTADTCLTATVTGLPDGCIEWTDFDGNVLGTGNELCVTPPVGTSYYIAGVPGLDCVNPDTVTVIVDTIPPVLPPNLPDTVLLCLNEMMTVAIGDYDSPFIWQNENGDTIAINEDLVLTGDSAGPASFVFEATNGCGSVSDTLVQVTIDSADIEILPSIDTLVVCDSLAIQLDALAPLGQEVVWMDGNGIVIDTAVTIDVMPEPGSNTYIASSVELGCVRSDTIVIEYVPEDLSVEITTPSSLICLGDDVDLEATLDPEDVSAIISWYDEDFEFIGEGEEITVTPIRSGLVVFFAVAENACSMDTANIEIEVEELILDIVGGDTTICTGDIATLEVIGCDDCTYEWTPEDRLTDPDAAITDAEPLRPSTYQVIVTGEVCRDTLTTFIGLETCQRCEVDKVFIADAFTPNRDMNNDLVCVRSEVLDQFSEIEFMIYNRWGQEVFRSNDMQNLCWDGTFEDEALPPDVYGYHMRIVCPGEEGEEDQVFNRQGNISLLR